MMARTKDFRVLVLMGALLALVTAAAYLMLAGPPASAAQTKTKTLLVDDDGAQCATAPYTSIQKAVDGAQSGDLIRVCPGVYHESVAVVDKSLTLKGDPNAVEAVDCFNPAQSQLGDADPTQQAVVDPPDDTFSEAFKLEANDIDLSGFIIQGASVGIDASDKYSGYHVHHNLIRLNTLFGMDFGSQGTYQSRVDHNCFRDAASTVINGQNRSHSWGLVSELDNDSFWLQSVSPIDPVFRSEHARDLKNAMIDHNSTFRNAAGLEAAGPGHHDDVTFANNVSSQDQISISIQNSVGSTIEGNQLSPTGFGVTVGGANPGTSTTPGLKITDNHIVPGQVGIYFAVPTGFYDVFNEPTSHATVQNNIVTTGASGIFTVPATSNSPELLKDSSLADNDISTNGNGIYLQAGVTGNTLSGNHVKSTLGNGIVLTTGVTDLTTGATDNTLSGNYAESNGRSGIVLRSGATGNIVSGNFANKNAQDGIWLATTNGAGATGNEISGNTAESNSRDGIRLEAGANNNTLSGNTANSNAANGIYAQGATGNTFTSNTMLGNATTYTLSGFFDARDDARTSNTWTANTCNTDSPQGTICGVQ